MEGTAHGPPQHNRHLLARPRHSPRHDPAVSLDAKRSSRGQEGNEGDDRGQRQAALGVCAAVRVGVEVPGEKKPSKNEVGHLISREDVGLWIFEECVKVDSARWEGKMVSLTH